MYQKTIPARKPIRVHMPDQKTLTAYANTIRKNLPVAREVPGRLLPTTCQHHG